MEYEIIRLTDKPQLKETAAQWFHEKWGIPLEAYTESMTECLTRKHAVPQWYMAMEDQRIIGGLGVIENDFHNRKDLSPNVCAVYTEEDKRCNGVAGFPRQESNQAISFRLALPALNIHSSTLQYYPV